MRMMNVLEAVTFRERGAHAEPLHVGDKGRILRFSLKPGQVIKEHRAPGAPLYILVLQGRGFFTDGSGEEYEAGPNDLLVFEPGESHAVRAGQEPFVFLAFLHFVPGVSEGKQGGTIS